MVLLFFFFFLPLWCAPLATGWVASVQDTNGVETIFSVRGERTEKEKVLGKTLASSLPRLGRSKTVINTVGSFLLVYSRQQQQQQRPAAIAAP